MSADEPELHCAAAHDAIVLELRRVTLPHHRPTGRLELRVDVTGLTGLLLRGLASLRRTIALQAALDGRERPNDNHRSWGRRLWSPP